MPSVAAVILSLATASFAQSNANPPTRLHLQVSAKTGRTGASFAVTIGLRDAYDLPSPARKAYRITLEVLREKTAPPLSKTTVLLEEGRDSVQTRIRLPQPGILMIKASHPELRESAAFVSVSARSGAETPMLRLTRALEARVVRVAWRPLRVAQHEPPAPAGPRTLTLRYSHEGTRLTANGKDADVIDAFLSRPAPHAISVNLWASSGQIEPNPIVIPARQTVASAELRTTQAGTTTISVQAVVPQHAAVVIEGGLVSARFWVPFKDLRLAASPSSTSLGSTSEIQVTLRGLAGEPVAPDEDKEVWVSHNLQGALDPRPLVLKAGQLGAQGRFTPQTTGRFEFEASTFGATTRGNARLDVDWPKLTLGILLVSGLMGGLLRAGQTLRAKREGRIRRAVIEVFGGPIVAVVAFAAVLLGFLSKEGLSPEVLTNPYGTPLIGIVSAYAGASVVGLLAKRWFGLPASAAARPSAPAGPATGGAGAVTK